MTISQKDCRFSEESLGKGLSREVEGFAQRRPAQTTTKEHQPQRKWTTPDFGCTSVSGCSCCVSFSEQARAMSTASPERLKE